MAQVTGPNLLTIESFCQGRYEHLKPYVKFATIKDWAKMEALEVAEVVPAKDGLKMLMAIFHRDLESQGLFTAPTQDFYGHGSLPRTLNLSRRVTSEAFTTSGATLQTFLASSTQKQLEELDAIDIRFCNLLDMDAGDVLALCREAVSLGANHLVVDISGNRFTPAAFPDLKAICLLDGVKYLFVPEIGHFDAKDQLAQLQPAVLEKLIFIRHAQLAGQGWKNILPDSSTALVGKTHDSFYSSYPAFAGFRM